MLFKWKKNKCKLKGTPDEDESKDGNQQIHIALLTIFIFSLLF